MLKKWYVLVSITIAVSLITVLSISAQESLIPSWIKNTAGFWVNGQVSDQEFLNAIQFLINNGMIKVDQQSSAKVPTYAPTPTPSYNPPGTIKFHPSNEEYSFERDRNQFTGYFALRTNSGDTVTASGKLYLKIINSNGQEVFSDRIYVIKDSFETFFHPETTEKYNAVKWSIPSQKISPANSPSGTLSITFEADGPNYEPKEILVPITGNLPTGTSSSSTSLESSGLNVGKDMNVGPFRITINKVSYVADQGYPYGKYLRLDMSIYNKRAENVELQFTKTSLTDDKKTLYDVDWSSKYKLETSYPPDTTKNGYLLFTDVPQGTKSVKLFLEIVVIKDISISDTYNYHDELEIMLS